MYSEIEHTLSRELEHVASTLVVPTMPTLPKATNTWRWQATAPVLAAAAVVVAGVAIGQAIPRGSDGDSGSTSA
ncbi:MAG: hypothetical protein WB767_05855, partial [Nocardioides sp.]